MKVLWFSNTPALGADFLNKNNRLKSTGGWLYSLNKDFQENVELSVAFHYPYDKGIFQYEKSHYFPIFTGNIVVENLKKRFYGKVYDSDFLTHYIEIIKKVNPDIIHIHGTENAFLCVLGKVDIPIVISIQGNLTIYQHKYHSGFFGKFLKKKQGNISLKSLLFGNKNFYKGYKNMEKMAEIEGRHLKLAKNIIGRTAWDKRITRILSPRSEYYIGNEMLRNKFYKTKWNNIYKSGKIILFTTNGDAYYKGFETLCYSLNLLNEMGLNIEWRVAGVSENSLINTITKQHLGEKYPNLGLVLLGSIDESRLINNMKVSHLYIMPSHIENSPNNHCEAMIVGMPCIATLAGGTSSIMKDGVEGVLIQDGDPWVMAGAVLELIKNGKLALELGVKAREKALLRHDKKRITTSLLETYNSIIIDNN